MKNQLKTAVLLGALTSVLLGVGALAAPGYLWVFGLFAILMNLGSYFYSDKIVLAIHRGHEVTEKDDPALHKMVRELAQKGGIPMPRLYIMDDERPNAFATGRNPAHGVVAVTTGIRRILTERELRGVIAHELSHIKNRDILVATVAAMIASIVAMVASVARWGMIFGGATTGGRDRDGDGDNDGLALLVLAIVAPIAATIIQLAISRSREYLADQTGGQLSGDPDALADALLKLERGHAKVPPHLAHASPATASLFIVNPLRGGGGVLKLFSTHPSTEDRVQRLRAQSRSSAGKQADHPFGDYAKNRR